jgi:tRNA threonylcarbamoyladenosine biosynthesis protein TsaE
MFSGRMGIMKVGSIAEMKKFASDFLRKISPSKNAVVVGLRGDLGSGKTTFVQQIANILGVKEIVTSPTFVIQKKYSLFNQKFKKLVHIDAYRLEDSHELEVLRWKHTNSDPSNLVLIEWPDRVKEIMPDELIVIRFDYIDENIREIKVIKNYESKK